MTDTEKMTDTNNRLPERIRPAADAAARIGFPVLLCLWMLFDMFFTSTMAGATFCPDDSLYRLLLRLLKFGTAGFIVLLRRHTWKELLVIVPVTAVLYYSSRCSEAPELFYSWLLILAAKDTEFRKTASLAAGLLAVTVPLTVLCSFRGVFSSLGQISYRSDGFVRYALGFVHPNRLALMLFVLTACFFCARKEKPGVLNYLLGIAVAVFAWFVPNSRTGAIGTAALTVLVFLFVLLKKHLPKLEKVLEWFLIAGTVIANLGTVGLILRFNAENPLIWKIDRLFTTRLTLGNRMLREVGLSAFGKRMYLSASERAAVGLGGGTVLLDNSYIRILLTGGIVVYVLFTVGTVLLMLAARRRHSPVLLVTVCVVLIYSSMEAFLLHAERNVILLAMAELAGADGPFAGLFRKKNSLPAAETGGTGSDT